jgi:iron complex transport system ATP-binding protein
MELKLEGAAFYYGAARGSRAAFEGVSFSARSPESLCILGSNGAGKSTLLKCAAGIERLKAGSAWYAGRNILSYGRRELAGIVAYMPQEHLPAFRFSALDVVTMGRTPRLGFFASPGERDAEAAEKNMEFLQISHLAPKPYTSLSGGERQMVMLAAALTQEPVFLLLDEPTSHLDYGNQHRFLDLLKNLKERGISVIMTSHFPDHAFAASDRVIVMKDGAITADGPPDEIITSAAMTALYGIPVDVMETRRGKRCVAGGEK